MRPSLVLLVGLGLSGCYKTGLDVTLDDQAGPVSPPTWVGDGSVSATPTGMSAAPGARDAGVPPPPRDAGAQPIAMITRPLTYYKDVKPIIDAKCSQCHVPGGMGHFLLTTYDEVKTLAPVIKGDVAGGKMPPWRATGPLDKYVGDRRLTEEQKSVIVSWVTQGAPAGDPSEAAPPVVADKRGLPRVDVSLPLPVPFTPAPNADTYRCFVMDWPAQQTKFITGLSIEPGNKELVHHSILYLVAPQELAAIKTREMADAEPGFECTAGVGLGAQWLTSYEPGGYG